MSSYVQAGSAVHGFQMTTSPGMCVQMRQWHYFHMACMKSMPDLLARKGGKMQQLMDFYAQRRIHEQFKGSGKSAM